MSYVIQVSIEVNSKSSSAASELADELIDLLETRKAVKSASWWDIEKVQEEAD